MANTIYDYPLYYDILFGWDRAGEAAFYDRLFNLADIGSDEPILEVASGTGEIAVRLARLSRPVVALDIRADMLAHLREKASAMRVAVRTICDDMRSFSDIVSYGGAFNPLSSFRLLHTDDDAGRHLDAMAAAIRSGGIYVLDLDFRERMDEPPVTTTEEWLMRRGDISIRATNDLIYVDDHGRRIELLWGAEGHLRNYTCETFSGLISCNGHFRVESWYPEVGREGEEEVSVFDTEHAASSCSRGRTMVVLRRQ